MQQFSDSFLLFLFFKSFSMPDLFVSIVDGLKEITFDQMLIYIQLKVLVEQRIINFCWNTHQAHSLVTNLPNDGLALRSTTFVHSTGQVLCGNQICDEELSELRCQYLGLFVENLCQIIVILLTGHSYLHWLIHVSFRGVVHSWTRVYSN